MASMVGVLCGQSGEVDKCVGGTMFVLAFPDTTTNTIDTRFEIGINDKFYLFLYSAIDNKVTISTGDILGKPEDVVLDLKGGEVTVHQIGNRPLVVTDNRQVSQNTYQVDAEYPVILYCYMATKFGAEAWTPIPVEWWGTEYYAATMPGEVIIDVSDLEGDVGEYTYGKRRKQAPSEVVVVAAFDDTRVKFFPGDGQAASLAQDDVVLDAGEAYLVQSFVDTTFGIEDYRPQDDLSGLYIQATRPIGVLSGNTRAQVQANLLGVANNATKNMLMEWLSPVGHHGNDFVYMPGMSRPEPSAYARLYGTNGPQGFGEMNIGRYTDRFGAERPFTVQEGGVKQFEFEQPQAYLLRTEEPAQGMYIAPGAAEFKRSVPSPKGIGSEYNMWGGFMVEMVPRRQWVSFAPVYTPAHPPYMEHALNLVTEKENAARIFIREHDGPEELFDFNMGEIPGTNLVWGTMLLTGGRDYYISSTEVNVLFSGYVYGFWKGFEGFRPGGIRKDGEAGILHPSEFEQTNALSYGYPLAPQRCASGPGDSLYINQSWDCRELRVKLFALNQNPIGLQRIFLEDAENAHILFTDPGSAGEVYRRKDAEFLVVPIDPLRDASARVVVEDRTEKRWTTDFGYKAEAIDIQPRNGIDFGGVSINIPTEIREVVLTNTLPKTVTVDGVELAQATAGYRIIDTDKPLPALLLPGERMVVRVNLIPVGERGTFLDTLILTIGCTRVRLPLNGTTIKPCIYVDDLDFGMMAPGEEVTLPLEICNRGLGTLRFNNPFGGNVLTWLNDNFMVSARDMTALETAVLGPDSCMVIDVTFNATESGLHQVRAAFWDNSEGCRDTSVWRGRVAEPGPRVTGYDWRKRWVTTLNGCTKSGKDGYDTVIAVYNTGSSDFKVAALQLVGPDADAGYFALDTTGPATTIRVGDVIMKGDTFSFRRYQRVIFRPKEERNYSCLIRLITEDDEIVESELLGRGIESGVSVSGYDFGSRRFRNNGDLVVPGTVLVTAHGTRPLSVTDLVIKGEHGGDFAFAPNFVDTLPTSARPWILASDQSVNVRLVFMPRDSGRRNAVLDVIADHSRCYDSTNTLTGHTYIPMTPPNADVSLSGMNFGRLLICDGIVSSIEFSNAGPDGVTVTDVQLVGTGPEQGFSVGEVHVPMVLDSGTSVAIPIEFSPVGEGEHAGMVRIVVVSEDGLLRDTLYSQLTGSGDVLLARTEIEPRASVYPGMEVTLPVMLHDELGEGEVDRLGFALEYSGDVILLSSLELEGTVLEGWRVDVSEEVPGRYVAALSAPSGRYLAGVGELLRLRFHTFLGEEDSAALSYAVVPLERPCVTMLPDSSGYVTLKTICGIGFRLVDGSGFRYRLQQNMPNPFNPQTEIQFSLGLDGPTALVVYNAVGERVAVLVDEYLDAGGYSVTWNAADYPSGLYYYRLISGHWTEAGQMFLRK